MVVGAVGGLLAVQHQSWITHFVQRMVRMQTNDILHTGCIWLMGIPAGFKDDDELTARIGTLWLHATTSSYANQLHALAACIWCKFMLLLVRMKLEVGDSPESGSWDSAESHKFEDLRAILGSKLMVERQLQNETFELIDQLKNDKEELQKLEKEVSKDEETLEFVKEDAEQADNEAMLARERQQNLILESTELMRIRKEYHKKIEEIEKEHFDGLLPMFIKLKIGFLHIEIKNARESIAEDLVKIGMTTKEILEGKEMYDQCSHECKVLKDEKIDLINKLKKLDEVPEKCHKQCNIMINALQALRNQDAKGMTKEMQVEAIVQSLYNTTRQKIEEHAKSISNMEKCKLAIEDKLSLVDLVRKKMQTSLEEMRKDIDILMDNLLVAENLGRCCNATRNSSQEQKQCQQIAKLRSVHVCLIQVAVRNHAKWKEVKDNIEIQGNSLNNFQKKVIEFEKEYKEFTVLYKLIRGQCNKYVQFLTTSELAVQEIKDKMKTLNTEVGQLQREVLYKVKVLNKMHINYVLSVKNRTALQKDIANCASMVKGKKLIVEELELDVVNLEIVINKVEKDMVKARKTYHLSLKDRNKVGIFLIDRNDELCILYERNNVQMELLKHSNVESAKRVDEIKLLKLACQLTHNFILTQHKTTHDPKFVYMELVSLREQMEKTCQNVSILSELIEKPSNLERWHLLPSRDNTTNELTRKALAIEEFFSTKEDQAYEKDIILEEVKMLVEDLIRKATLAQHKSIRVGKQMNFYLYQMNVVTRQITATISELSLVQAIAIKVKQERERAQLNLDKAIIRLENGEPNTTAESRPNAYIVEHLGLPKSFGNNSPFRPLECGNTIRHFHKSQMKVIEV
ncbi:unnamed protein product [Sphagnum troendelagicum]|uniref:Cilia- and flagella-associated protein 58 central coiled coil domain-containing protein n=1 Tax=Sphagnum troendelagicum TaxID=128251 RepID=A0ABP0TI50_9BRYO